VGRDAAAAIWGPALVPALVLPFLIACANQKDTTPLLRVEPNAAARFFYFEKRAAAMIREQRGPEPEAEQAAEEECLLEEPPALRTWGAPDPPSIRQDGADDAEAQGTSCDRAQND